MFDERFANWTRTKWTAIENEKNAGRQQSWGRLPCIEILVPLEKDNMKKKKTLPECVIVAF